MNLQWVVLLVASMAIAAASTPVKPGDDAPVLALPVLEGRTYTVPITGRTTLVMVYSASDPAHVFMLTNKWSLETFLWLAPRGSVDYLFVPARGTGSGAETMAKQLYARVLRAMDDTRMPAEQRQHRMAQLFFATVPAPVGAPWLHTVLTQDWQTEGATLTSSVRIPEGWWNTTAARLDAWYDWVPRPPLSTSPSGDTNTFKLTYVPDACFPVTQYPDVQGRWVLTSNSSLCRYADMARHAQEAGALGLIVHASRHMSPEVMMPPDVDLDIMDASPTHGPSSRSQRKKPVAMQLHPTTQASHTQTPSTATNTGKQAGNPHGSTSQRAAVDTPTAEQPWCTDGRLSATAQRQACSLLEVHVSKEQGGVTGADSPQLQRCKEDLVLTCIKVTSRNAKLLQRLLAKVSQPAATAQPQQPADDSKEHNVLVVGSRTQRRLLSTPKHSSLLASSTAASEGPQTLADAVKNVMKSLDRAVPRDKAAQLVGDQATAAAGTAQDDNGSDTGSTSAGASGETTRGSGQQLAVDMEDFTAWLQHVLTKREALRQEGRPCADGGLCMDLSDPSLEEKLLYDTYEYYYAEDPLDDIQQRQQYHALYHSMRMALVQKYIQDMGDTATDGPDERDDLPFRPTVSIQDPKAPLIIDADLLVDVATRNPLMFDQLLQAADSELLLLVQTQQSLPQVLPGWAYEYEDEALQAHAESASGEAAARVSESDDVHMIIAQRQAQALEALHEVKAKEGMLPSHGDFDSAQVDLAKEEEFGDDFSYEDYYEEGDDYTYWDAPYYDADEAYDMYYEAAAAARGNVVTQGVWQHSPGDDAVPWRDLSKEEAALVHELLGTKPVRSVGGGVHLDGQDLGDGDDEVVIPMTQISFEDGIILRDQVLMYGGGDGEGVYLEYHAPKVPQGFLGIDSKGHLIELGWVKVPTLMHMAWQAEYQVYLDNLQAALHSQPPHLEIELMAGQNIGGEHGHTVKYTLPPPSTLRSYSRLLLDMSLSCPGPRDTDCPQWDHVVQLFGCCGEQCKECDITPWSHARSADTHDARLPPRAAPLCGFELGRWITPFRRNSGRWVTDVTPLIPLLSSRECTFTMQTPPWAGDWVASISLLFSHWESHLPALGQTTFSTFPSQPPQRAADTVDVREEYLEELQDYILPRHHSMQQQAAEQPSEATGSGDINLEPAQHSVEEQQILVNRKLRAAQPQKASLAAEAAHHVVQMEEHHVLEEVRSHEHESAETMEYRDGGSVTRVTQTVRSFFASVTTWSISHVMQAVTAVTPHTDSKQGSQGDLHQHAEYETTELTDDYGTAAGTESQHQQGTMARNEKGSTSSNLPSPNVWKALLPTVIYTLFEGGVFNSSYNDRPPMYIRTPKGAVKAVITAVISGHGSDDSNCAEFCATSHHFAINSVERSVDFDTAGTTWGCTRAVADGAVPNERGTWFYGRNGWCDGQQVKPWMADVSDVVAPAGEVSELRYYGLHAGHQPHPQPEDQAGYIIMSSYLTFYMQAE